MKNSLTEILSSRAFVKEVVQIIEHEFEHEELESIGDNDIIAGGSVAAACCQALGIDIPYRYKDLDVFVPTPHRSAFGKIAIKDVTGMVGDTSMHQFCGKLNFGPNAYAVENSVMKGKLNFIVCSFINCHSYYNFDQQLYSVTEIAKSLLQGFDLNQSQIAITRKGLVFTESFIDFLLSLQLKVVNFSTPCHTLVRLHEKAKQLELDLVTDSPNYTELLEHIHLTNVLDQSLSNGGNSISVGTLFGQVYRERFNKAVPNAIAQAAGLSLANTCAAYTHKKTRESHTADLWRLSCSLESIDREVDWLSSTISRCIALHRVEPTLFIKSSFRGLYAMMCRLMAQPEKQQEVNALLDAQYFELITDGDYPTDHLTTISLVLNSEVSTETFYRLIEEKSASSYQHVIAQLPLAQIEHYIKYAKVHYELNIHPHAYIVESITTSSSYNTALIARHGHALSPHVFEKCVDKLQRIRSHEASLLNFDDLIPF
ncbi:hypothetical protein L1D14_07555 [Vibrio tubiashii]|uniref:hypothetical protein n=1 Tax=Vibrio tubiashii TaxID=29498 RepID=UPI001EFEA09B|nr:hypothetical protein [Vibrio tubiashii]MCG9576094.1 hypothetical protein [Vibrio tubiashii]